MNNWHLGLLFIVLAAISGLVGVTVIYHYATRERSMLHFSIVIDAGSTQTRSSLFTIRFNSPAIVDFLDEEQSQRLGLTKLVQVQQVGSCVNGQALTELSSSQQARQLVSKCLGEFSGKIKNLDVLGSSGKQSSQGQRDSGSGSVSLSGTTENQATYERVNSFTQVHLGATAGMRALSLMNRTKADERISWMDDAIRETQPKAGPYLNRGFVGIIEGQDEATFAWTSANFVCGQLQAEPTDRGIEVDSVQKGRRDYSNVVYAIEGHDGGTISEETLGKTTEPNSNRTISLGTIELGGNSLQMAYELWKSSDGLPEDGGMEAKQVDLFNIRYKLAVRSDLCMGSSQALFRTNYLLLQQVYKPNSTSYVQRLELTNPCLQNRSNITMNSSAISKFLQNPCLNGTIDTEFWSSLSHSIGSITFRGSGNMERCNSLLSNLIEPQLCSRYFSICPKLKNQLPPPEGVPFVTISGYNKAIEVLSDLRQKPTGLGQSQIEQQIAQKLGGHSIVHSELLQAINEFCSTDEYLLAFKYPKLNKNFYAVNCLQLVYINKLLTEFYHFKPETSWNSIKFLIFPSAIPLLRKGERIASQPTESSLEPNPKEDIGWTLGLLLNDTSSRFSDANSQNSPEIVYRHAGSVIFVFKLTLVLMVTLLVLGMCLLLFILLALHRNQRKAYISQL